MFAIRRTALMVVVYQKLPAIWDLCASRDVFRCFRGASEMFSQKNDLKVPVGVELDSEIFSRRVRLSLSVRITTDLN